MTNFDILCLTPSRWCERVRRMRHLMRVAARHHRVVVVEESDYLSEDTPLATSNAGGESGIRVYRPADRAWSMSRSPVRTSVRAILDAADPSHLTMWVESSRGLALVPSRNRPIVVCDLHAPARAGSDSLAVADLVLADGVGSYGAARQLHPRSYLFPHAVDVEHFSRARARHREPPDQAMIPGPRVGFWGTIDARIEFGLLEALAARMPQVHFVMIGPVERSGREGMRARANLHWLGSRAYADLPDYASGWSAAILPFARNDATRFLSPPQIPEFLAAGRSIVSTQLPDVVHPYGASGLVTVADTTEEFAKALEATFAGQRVEWLTTVDRYLRALSWESSWEGIEHLLNAELRRRTAASSIDRREERVRSLTPASILH